MRYGVFLRAVNVGGTGKLPMQELRRICAECGFEDIKTYIASGNVVFHTGRDAAQAQISQLITTKEALEVERTTLLDEAEAMTLALAQAREEIEAIADNKLDLKPKRFILFHLL